jgi:rod shape-determining protein MreC
LQRSIEAAPLLRLSIQARQALARLTLPALIVLSLATILLGRASPVAPERMRTALSDALAPIYAVLAVPLSTVRDAAADIGQVFTLRSENLRLRAENDRLRRWYDVAMALDAENTELKANLHWIPDPALSYVTARVVADAGGVYARSVLLSLGPNHAVRKGQIALDANGLVGRVTEVGARSARVLLITDMNSRIPVLLEHSRAKAILVGGNTPYPRLMYLPEGTRPAEGERVVTSAEANAFPAGLTVGTVHYGSATQPEVDPAANLERLEIVRIFDYGLGGIVPPEAPGRTALASP